MQCPWAHSGLIRPIDKLDDRKASQGANSLSFHERWALESVTQRELGDCANGQLDGDEREYVSHAAMGSSRGGAAPPRADP